MLSLRDALSIVDVLEPSKVKVARRAWVENNVRESAPNPDHQSYSLLAHSIRQVSIRRSTVLRSRSRMFSEDVLLR